MPANQKIFTITFFFRGRTIIASTTNQIVQIKVILTRFLLGGPMSLMIQMQLSPTAGGTLIFSNKIKCIFMIMPETKLHKAILKKLIVNSQIFQIIQIQFSVIIMMVMFIFLKTNFSGNGNPLKIKVLDPLLLAWVGKIFVSLASRNEQIFYKSKKIVILLIVIYHIYQLLTKNESKLTS